MRNSPQLFIIDRTIMVDNDVSEPFDFCPWDLGIVPFEPIRQRCDQFPNLKNIERNHLLKHQVAEEYILFITERLQYAGYVLTVIHNFL